MVGSTPAAWALSVDDRALSTDSFSLVARGSKHPRLGVSLVRKYPPTNMGIAAKSRAVMDSPDIGFSAEGSS